MMSIQSSHIYRIDLDRAPLEIRLENPLTQQDAQADTFSAILRRGMEPLDLSGMTVHGFLTLESQKLTIPLDGAADGNDATLTLPSACYAQAGPFTLTLQLHDGDVRHTVLHIRGCFARSTAGTVMDPEDVIPTLAELLGEIDQMRQATARASAAADQADEARLGIDGRLDEFRADVYSPLTVAWQEGGLHTSHGTHYANTARSRTPFLPARMISAIRTCEGYAAAVYAYNAGQGFLGMTAWEPQHTVQHVLEAYPDTVWLRINFKATDDRVITPDEAAQNAVISITRASLLAERMACTRELLGSLFTPVPLENGGLYGADGSQNDNTQRLRTGYIPVDELALARCDGNYRYLYMAYQNGAYIDCTKWDRSPITAQSVRATYPTATHIRILVGASVDRNLEAADANADPGILILRSNVHQALKAQEISLTEEAALARAAIAEEIAAVVSDCMQAREALDAKIAAITNDGTRAHSLLEEKIASATDGAAKAREAIEAMIAQAAQEADKTHAELGRRIDDAASDATANSQLLTSMIISTVSHIQKAAQSDGITASLSMYDRIGICGASWDSGYIYTSHTSTIEEERLSWPHLLAMRCGFTYCNYSYHGLGAKDWLTHENGGVEMLADEPCDLYVCTLGGNDMRKRGISYIGTLADITGYSDPADYPDSFFGRYGRIIESIRSHAPHARIMLIFWYSPALHDPEGNGRKKYFEAVQAIAEHYGLPYMNWGEDPWYDSVNDNQLGAHPTAVQLSGISYAFERLYSTAVNRFYRYFCHYPQPAPDFVPLKSNLDSTVWISGTGNGYSSSVAGTEMLARLNTAITGLFATEGQGTPLRELDMATGQLSAGTMDRYPILVPTYATAVHVEGPDGCELRIFTAILKRGVWYSEKMYDWGGSSQTVDLTTSLVDGVCINLRNGDPAHVRVWFE